MLCPSVESTSARSFVGRSRKRAPRRDFRLEFRRVHPQRRPRRPSSLTELAGTRTRGLLHDPGRSRVDDLGEHEGNISATTPSQARLTLRSPIPWLAGFLWSRRALLARTTRSNTPMVRNAMKEGLPGWQAPVCQLGATERRPDFNVARRFGSQPQASRFPSTR